MDQKGKDRYQIAESERTDCVHGAAWEKAFRAKQIYQWLHVKQAASFEEMTNIPKALIEKLEENSHLVSIKTGGSTDLQNRRNEEIPVSVR